jgi:hypothetical protein
MQSVLQVVINNGVPADLIYFLLMVPFIVMVGTFVRHVLGMKVLGMSVIVSMAYIAAFLLREYSLLSVSIGTGVIVFIYLFSYYVKRLTIHLGLHYFSRISIVITMISLSLLAILVIAGRFPELVDSAKLYETSPFAVVIAVLLSEHFSSNQTQKGIKKSRQLFLNSLIVAFLVGLLVSWDPFQTFSFENWYLVFAWMIMTFLFGKYTGMRVNELFRFRDIKLDKNR